MAAAGNVYGGNISDPSGTKKRTKALRERAFSRAFSNRAVQINAGSQAIEDARCCDLAASVDSTVFRNSRDLVVFLSVCVLSVQVFGND